MSTYAQPGEIQTSNLASGSFRDFLLGFKRQWELQFYWSGIYLTLNLVVIARGLPILVTHRQFLLNWHDLFQSHRQSADDDRHCVFDVPKLALGLSGFETGVVVMPLIKGDASQRIRNTHKLLFAAATVMAVFSFRQQYRNKAPPLLSLTLSRRAVRRLVAGLPLSHIVI